MNSPALPQPAGSSEQTETDRLRETLKRCPPQTFAAVCRFRDTRDPAALRVAVAGIVERYVERELRPRLAGESDSLRLVEDLGLDSLTLMEIVVLAEDVLGFSVSNEELVRLKTLADVQRFVAEKVG